MNAVDKEKEIASHFDEIAENYDYWKKKNWYYYNELKRIATEFCAGATSVLDAGCGTGTILGALKVNRGVGVDISSRMIELAKSRYHHRPELQFFAADASAIALKEKFDVILLFDVIEHLPNPVKMLGALQKLLAKNGRLVITMANPLWEPVLMLAEKLHLKMPEGSHKRITGKTLIATAETVALWLERRDRRLLFPKSVPIISDFLNRRIARLPIFRSLCLIEILVFRTQPQTNHEKGL
jgi:2-polyprenyl-3-methyl-5-hydroxy-6-metoxy-1,4-benzoquinol methylase